MLEVHGCAGCIQENAEDSLGIGNLRLDFCSIFFPLGAGYLDGLLYEELVLA